MKRTLSLLALAALMFGPLSAQEDGKVTIHFHAIAQSTYTNNIPDYGMVRVSIVEGKNLSNPATGVRTRISEATVPDHIETPWTDIHVEVGRIYHALVEVNQYVIHPSINVQLKLPPGYFYEFINQAGPFLPGTHKFRVMPDNADAVARRAGEAESLMAGRLSWGVSLGARGNGTSAGSLRLIDVGFDSSWNGVFTPAGLKVVSRLSAYNTPNTEGAPFIPGAPRQMKTPEALVDIYPISATEYELRFYDASLFTETTYPYDVSGKTPYVVYNLSRGSTSTKLQITKKTFAETGYPTTWLRSETTSIERTGTWPAYTWTVNDWNQTGQTQLVQTLDAWAQPSDATHNYKAVLSVQQPGTPAQVATKAARKMKAFSWGEVPLETQAGPDEADLASATTSYTYYDNSSHFDSYTRVKTVVSPTGAWEAYEYYGLGESGMTNGGFRVHRPYLSAPASPPANLATNTSGEISTYSFAPRVAGDRRPVRLGLVTKTINNTTVSKTEFYYHEAAGFLANGQALVRTTRYDWVEDSASTRLKTVTRYYDGSNDGLGKDQMFSIERPDKTKSVYAYHGGTWNDSTKTFASGAGTATRVAVVHGTTDTNVGVTAPSYDGYALVSTGDTETDVFRLVSGRSTLELTIRNSRALVVRREVRVWTGTAWETISWEDLAYDRAGFLTTRTNSNGAIYSATYSGEVKTAETDSTGVMISYTHDTARQVTQMTRASGGAVPAVTTTIAYDTLATGGRKITQTVGSNPTAVSSRTFDTAGRLIQQTVPGPNATPLTTGITYNAATRTRTTTLPTTKQVVETKHLDGSIVSVTSPNGGAIPTYFQYAVESGTTNPGHRMVRVNIAVAPPDATTASPRHVESWSDWLGRPVKSSRPGLSGTTQTAMVEQSYYDGTTGQLIRTSRTGYADTVYEYDSMGRIKRSGLDVNASQSLTDASLDRIIETDAVIESFDNAWWLKETASTFFVGGAAASKRISTTRTRLTGFTGNVQVESRTWDADETNDTLSTTETSRTTIEVNRTGKTVTATTQRKGLTAANAVRLLTNGYLTSETGHDGLTFTQQYDALLRPSVSTDPRTGNTTTTYKSGSSFVDYVQFPGPAAPNDRRITYSYDSAGRVEWMKDPEGKYTRFRYDDLGRVDRQWGSGTQPVEYVYDATYGERTLMKTYRGGTWTNASGDTWDATATADLTKWVYDAASGLLKEKYDAANLTATGEPRTTPAAQKVAYEYNSRGQVSKRTWARGVYATYGYSGTTGELTSIDYSDSTPDVAYAYTRTGQLQSATVAGVTAHTFAYDGDRPWRLDRTELGGFYGNRWLTPLYQAGTETGGMLGRGAGFQLGTSADRDSDLAQTWEYLASGRFDKLASAYAGANARKFTYGYEDNSSLLKTLAVTNPNGTASPFSVTRTYESTRNVVTAMTTKWSTTTVAEFDYGYDKRGLREWETRGGTDFTIGGETLGIDYQYNDRGELVQAFSYLGTDITAPEAAKKMPNLQHAFEYDHAGNRTSANQTGDAARKDTFVPNQLNQIDSRTNKSVIASGTTGTGVAVTVGVNGAAPVAANTLGVYWSKAVTPGNGSGPDSADLAITATQGAAQRTETRVGFVGHQTAQTLSYDADGNLTTDGIWNYVYDAENRLIQMTTTPIAVTAGFPNRTLEFKYDHLGRRVQKRSLNATTSTETWRRYLYDGWNVVAEFDAPSGASCGNLVRSYTWGLDIAGSPSATGGVGALLQFTDHTAGVNKTFLPAYDGNGNVMALYDADGTTATAAVVYEYSPFGEQLRASINGNLSQAVKDALASQPFRFSTKFTDTESGLIYYGHRYYSPMLGRFINRDPIEEAGGLNLYGFAGNDGVNGMDVLGLHGHYADRTPSDFDITFPWPGGDPEDLFDTEFERAAERIRRDEAVRIGRETSDAVFDATVAAGAQISEQRRYERDEVIRNGEKPTGNSGGNAPNSVAGEAWDAAVDGGGRHVQRVIHNVVYLPQTIVDTIGAIGGYIVNLGDSGTRNVTVADTVNEVKKVGDPEEWKRTGEYLISPEGTADLVVFIDGSLAGVPRGAAPGVYRGPPVRPSSSPAYSVVVEARLRPGTFKASDAAHFRQANKQLYEALKADPQLAARLEAQYPGITQHVTPGPRGGFADTAPPGFSWHHHPTQPGVVQLVPRTQHQAPGPVQQSLHPDQKGGRENWGGGRKRP